MLRAILDADAFAALPEPLRDHYVVQDAQADQPSYQLQVERVDDFGLEDVGGLQRSLQSARAERDAAQRDLRGWSAFKGEGDKQLTPVEVQEELRRLREQVESSKGKVDPNEFERQKADALAEAERQAQERERVLQEARDKAMEARDREILNGRLAALAADSELNLRPEALKHLRSELAERGARVVEENGEHVIRFFKGDEKAMSKSTGRAGEYMDVKEVVESMRELPETSYFFRVDRPDNSGAGGGGKANTGGAPQFDGRMTPEFRAFMESQPEAADRMVQAYAAKNGL